MEARGRVCGICVGGGSCGGSFDCLLACGYPFLVAVPDLALLGGSSAPRFHRLSKAAAAQGRALHVSRPWLRKHLFPRCLFCNLNRYHRYSRAVLSRFAKAAAAQGRPPAVSRPWLRWHLPRHYSLYGLNKSKISHLVARGFQHPQTPPLQHLFLLWRCFAS